MSETNQTYLAMVRREHQPVTGFDRAICGRCGAVDRREGYPCAALVLLDALATERARAEAAERDGQRLLTLNAAVAGENARLRAELARTLAAQRMAEENSRSHFVADGEGVSICRICDQPDDHTRTVIDHTPDCPFAALAATHENPGVQHAADSEEVAPESGSDGSMSSGQLDTSDSEPWCTVDSHIVLPSGEACICGENRMELML